MPTRFRLSLPLVHSQGAGQQERRNRLRINLDSLGQRQEFHIDNLETALGIITQVGSLYNRLEASARRELLLHMVKQVVVNTDGEIVLELNAPFAYLKDLSDKAKESSELPARMQTSDASDDIGCSACVLRVSTGWMPSEPTRRATIWSDELMTPFCAFIGAPPIPTKTYL